jgi:hypothetical protein
MFRSQLRTVDVDPWALRGMHVANPADPAGHHSLSRQAAERYAVLQAFRTYRRSSRRASRSESAVLAAAPDAVSPGFASTG